MRVFVGVSVVLILAITSGRAERASEPATSGPWRRCRQRTELRKILSVLTYDRDIAKIARIHSTVRTPPSWRMPGGSTSSVKSRRFVAPCRRPDAGVHNTIDPERHSAHDRQRAIRRGHNPRSGLADRTAPAGEGLLKSLEPRSNVHWAIL